LHLLDAPFSPLIESYSLLLLLAALHRCAHLRFECLLASEAGESSLTLGSNTDHMHATAQVSMAFFTDTLIHPPLEGDLTDVEVMHGGHRKFTFRSVHTLHSMSH